MKTPRALLAAIAVLAVATVCRTTERVVEAGEVYCHDRERDLVGRTAAAACRGEVVDAEAAARARTPYRARPPRPS